MTSRNIASAKKRAGCSSKRAAWTAVGESRPLMETGLGNLTQDMVGLLIHFENGDTQRWLMSRLNDLQQASRGK
jgi:hypothetical protein